MDGYFWLSLCLAAVGQFDESARVARRGLEVDPHSANLQTALGWRFLLERQFDAAERELARAEALDASASFASWTHGYALQQLGRFDEAFAAFDRAIAVTGERTASTPPSRERRSRSRVGAPKPERFSRTSTGAPGPANTFPPLRPRARARLAG